ncbi:PAS domain-containing protein [Eilatimonas milleporae]|uniref:PAS domain-containing protein n=1 Tax=Eilatimonas milleporae TaxID=911205 RepID=A0A3M0C8I6_9PROT|nr:PAS domain-containing protein [Eilatimonas milleporae]RMB04670.1 PAS domain-containing protein [Eilatimonas milleporae]
MKLPSVANVREIRQVADAWNAWRRGALLPRRDQMRLKDLDGVFDRCFMLEMRSPTEMVFVFMGSMFQRVTGHDYTGLNFLEYSDPGIRALRSRRMMTLVNKPCACVWTICDETLPMDTPRFVGLALPLLPTEPCRPPFVFEVMAVLDDDILIERAPEPGVLRLTDMFRYIDIGAGHPGRELES